MATRNLSLTPRNEDTREKQSIEPVIQFELIQIKEHFEDSMQSIEQQFAIAEKMKEEGYGAGYQYAHDTKEKLTTMECLPPSLIGKTYYHPGIEGNEVRFKNRLEQIKDWKKKHREAEKN